MKKNISPKDVEPKEYMTRIINDHTGRTRFLSCTVHREYVPFHMVPKNLANAVIAVEDRRFYMHKGLDPKAIVRAMCYSVFTFGKRLQGGSTITQQLIKNTMFDNWTNESTLWDKLSRKSKEFIWAPSLERKISKEKILEDYLNAIYFGNGCYGVQTAARFYLGKNVWELSLGECAMIAGIPKHPSRYNPFFDVYISMGRRKVVLSAMLEEKMIRKEDYLRECRTDITDMIRRQKEKQKLPPRPYSYFEDALIDQVRSDLMEKGFTLKKARKKLFSGGLHIYSTENEDLQKYAEMLCADRHIIPDASDEGLQVAVLMMEISTGKVLASVGGKGTKTAGLVFDRVNRSRRKRSGYVMKRYFERTGQYSEDGPGISLMDMCMAYLSYESEQAEKKPYYYDRILDKSGNVVLTSEKPSEKPKPSGKEYPLPKMIEITTERDIWVIGKAGNSVLGVWDGYDDNRCIPHRKEYYTCARKIWHELSKQEKACEKQINIKQ